MSKHAAYAPRHRGAPDRPLKETPKKAARTVLISALAVAGTGAGVAGGLSLGGGHPAATEVASYSANVSSLGVSGTGAAAAAASAPDRSVSLSRSYDRVRADPLKAASLDALTSSDDTATTGSEDLADQDPHAIASALLADHGWDGSQYACLVSLWNRESGWNVHAANPSGAYGIPQSLPGSKMASAGADWQDSAETQIKWGLGYIAERYGSPCGAWGHSQATGWY